MKVPIEREEFTKLYEAFDLLKNNYYKDIDDEKVVDGAINGMFDALDDPYSDFMVKEEADQFNSGLSSSFQGIGAKSKNVMVILQLCHLSKILLLKRQAYYQKILS